MEEPLRPGAATSGRMVKRASADAGGIVLAARRRRGQCAGQGADAALIVTVNGDQRRPGGTDDEGAFDRRPWAGCACIGDGRGGARLRRLRPGVPGRLRRPLPRRHGRPRSRPPAAGHRRAVHRERPGAQPRRRLWGTASARGKVQALCGRSRGRPGRLLRRGDGERHAGALGPTAEDRLPDDQRGRDHRRPQQRRLALPQRRQGDGGAGGAAAAVLRSLPEKDRASREDLVRTANSYFTGLAANTGRNTAPFAPTCNRLENGTQTTNNPQPKAQGRRHHRHGLRRPAEERLLPVRDQHPQPPLSGGGPRAGPGAVRSHSSSTRAGSRRCA